MTLRKRFTDDGMQHDYETCPKCGEIASTEHIVRVDGRKMCRECLKRLIHKGLSTFR